MATSGTTPPPPLSFKDAVARPKIPFQEATEVKAGSSYKGEPALLFTKEEFSKLAAPFDLTLIGKFEEARPNLVFLRKGFQMIGFHGDVDIGLLDTHHVLLRFSQHEDYYRFWMRGSWNFKKHVMRVLKWSPDFTCDREPPVAPVWVSFNHLPIHLFQQGPLMSIAALLGRPLKIDAATKNLTRPSMARICIEINLLHVLPKRIWIGYGDAGFWQAVTYEQLPQYCSRCFRLGHATMHCTGELAAPPPENSAPSGQIWKKNEAPPSSSGLTSADKAEIPTDINPPQNPSSDDNTPVEGTVVGPQEKHDDPTAPKTTIVEGAAQPELLVQDITDDDAVITHEDDTSLVHDVSVGQSILNNTEGFISPAASNLDQATASKPALDSQLSPMVDNLSSKDEIEDLLHPLQSISTSVPISKPFKEALTTHLSAGNKPLLENPRAVILEDLRRSSLQLNKFFTARTMSKAPSHSLQSTLTTLTEVPVDGDDSIDLADTEDVTTMINEEDFIPVQKKKRGRPRKTIKHTT